MNLISRGRSASNQTSPIFRSELGYQGARCGEPQTFSLKIAGRRTGLLPLTDEALDAIESTRELGERGGVGEANVFPGAKRLAGNHGDMRFGKQALGELQRRRDGVPKCN